MVVLRWMFVLGVVGLFGFSGWYINELQTKNKELKKQIEAKEIALKAVGEYIADQEKLNSKIKKQRKRIRNAFKKKPTVRFNDIFPAGM